MRVREIVGSVGELHAEAMPTTGEDAELWVMRPQASAVAMGSSQQPELFDTDRMRRDGVELAERRSGGGAVYIDPAQTVWIDALLPRSSPLWSNELAVTFANVGRVWQRALSALGVTTELYGQSPKRTDAATLACWAGLGWGEVHIDDTKIVGLSQRRTRWGARVQAMAVVDQSSADISDYFASDEHQQLVATAIPVTGVEALQAAGISPDRLRAAVITAFTG